MARRGIEVWNAMRHVRNPPRFKWEEGDVLFVLDAIEAYSDLIGEDGLLRLQMLVRSAREEAVPIVFTRWVRTGEERGDCVDQKRHWSNYVPKGKTDFLPNLVEEDEDDVANVIYPNAFTSETVNSIVCGGGCKRMVLSGSWTESCIYHTAHECLPCTERPPAVLKDACFGHFPSSFLSLVQIQLFVGDVFSIPHSYTK